MAGDFNKPVVTDAYASVLQSIKDLISDLAKGLDGTGTTNVPVNTIRWSSTNNRFEKYNGSSWAALASRYAIDVATVAGKSVGNANGNIPLSNGTLNTNLNAQLFNGLASNVFSKSASNLDNSVIAADTRSSNHAPQDRAAGAYFDFRANSTDGLSDGGTYHGVMSFRTFASGTDFSGGNAHQLGFTDNGNLWYRAGSGAAWGSWTKFLTDSNFNATIGAGARNLAGAGTYGGVNITGAANGWAGFQFNSTSRYFMSSSGQTGEYDTSAEAWQWRWDNGTLAAGTVPWARLSGVPSLSFYPVGGGNLSGYVAVANEGASPEPYGAISVTKPNVTETPSYFSMTRAGQFTASIGINPSNQMVFGNGTSGSMGRITSSWMTLNGSGQVWTSNYGWLHDYFVTSGATYWELKYSWPAGQATVGPSINCHANYGAGVYLAVVDGNPKPFITNGYGAIAKCDVLVNTSPSYTTVTGSGDVAPTPPLSKSLYIYKLRKV